MDNRYYKGQTQVVDFIEFKNYFESIKDYDYLKAKFVEEKEDKVNGKNYEVINNPFVLEYIYNIMIDQYEWGYPGPGPDTRIPEFDFELEGIIINTMLNFKNFRLFSKSGVIPKERYYRYIKLIDYGQQYLKFWNKEWNDIPINESQYTMRSPDSYLIMEYLKKLKFDDTIKFDYSNALIDDDGHYIIKAIMEYFLRNLNYYVMYHQEVDVPEEHDVTLEEIKHNLGGRSSRVSLFKDDLYDDYIYYINLFYEYGFKNQNIMIKLFKGLNNDNLDKLRDIFLEKAPSYIKDTKENILSEYIYELMDRISERNLSEEPLYIYHDKLETISDMLVKSIDNL